MVDREHTCMACEGTGMLADDEGWQYKCSICDGGGMLNDTNPTKLFDVDANNRLLD
ncbi:hypothetical protein LG329_11810 [Virgibacillus necropolis]|uniref:hypothetical protein n=1 Tax=Virgibacillus necropolis TaxID=163877 RepID=UPI00384F3B89